MRKLNFLEIQEVSGARVIVTMQGQNVNVTMSDISDDLYVGYGDGCDAPWVKLAGDGGYDWFDNRAVWTKYFDGPQSDLLRTSASITNGVAHFTITR